jgi:hypothetical protein
MRSLRLSWSPSLSRTMLDVPMFTADLPGVADGRRTLFDELARLAKPETELTVSEFAYNIASPRRSRARLSRALGAPTAFLICANRWIAYTPITRRGG